MTRAKSPGPQPTPPTAWPTPAKSACASPCACRTSTTNPRPACTRTITRITPNDFAAQWDADQLSRYEPTALEGVPIPEVSKRFLVEAGLPCQAGLDLEFDLAGDELPTLTEALKENLPAKFSRYRPLGVTRRPLFVWMNKTMAAFML